MHRAAACHAPLRAAVGRACAVGFAGGARLGRARHNGRRRALARSRTPGLGDGCRRSAGPRLGVQRGRGARRQRGCRPRRALEPCAAGPRKRARLLAGGAGVGVFPATFALHERLADVTPEFVNRAHDDALELVFEGGALSLMLAAGFLVWLVACARAAIRSRNDGALAGLMAMALLLLHSLVDYPLRTIALGCVFACCAALQFPAAETPTGATFRWPWRRKRRRRRMSRHKAPHGGHDATHMQHHTQLNATYKHKLHFELGLRCELAVRNTATRGRRILCVITGVRRCGAGWRRTGARGAARERRRARTLVCRTDSAAPREARGAASRCAAFPDLLARVSARPSATPANCAP